MMDNNLFFNLITANNFNFKEGIWYSSENANLSYPEEGNQVCYQVEDDSFWFNHRNHCILELVKKYAADDDFYDFGGGNGFVTKGLIDAGIDAILVEPGSNGVLNAKKRGVNKIICSTTTHVSFLNGKIKSIGVFDVLEHLEDDIKFVQELNNLLDNDGYLFITVPAIQTLWSQDDLDAGHFRRYTQKSITKLLTSNGFEIKYSSYFFCILVFPLFLIRTLPSLLGLRKKTLSNVNKDHANKKGGLGKFLNRYWQWEINKISNHKKLAFGTSIIVVAKKVSQSNSK
jgi:SAM-dependent methyltransferase